VSQADERVKILCSPEAIAPAADPASRASVASGATGSTAPVPVGFSISVAFAGLVVGAGAARLIHEASPWFAWMTVTALCGGLFGLGRRWARASPTRASFLLLLALAPLTFSYLLVLGGESIPRPIGPGLVSFFTVVVMLLAVLAAAAALPAIILVATLRSGRPPELHQLRQGVTPQLLTASTGAVMALLALLLLATTLWASSPQWRVPAILSVALGSPLLLLPVGAYLYQRLLSRGRAAQPPSALLEGLQELRDLRGFEFDEVLCLQAPFGGGRVCQVVTRPGRSTLVISESIADDLSSAQLLAVLAHEAAHVRLNHFRRKIAWGVIAGITTLTTAIVAQTLFLPVLPRALQFAGALGILLPLFLLRSLYDAFVIRRHEAEADEFAIDTAGGQALLDALCVLGASGPGELLVHNRWTTHSTWERRVHRIRQKSLS
jgi:Zn-dependent protease with chaperone function